jgi:hypothetical protein
MAPHSEGAGNGHGREDWDPLADTIKLDSGPLPFHSASRRRSLWSRLMSTRPARSMAGELIARPAPLTIGALISIGIFLVGQLVAAMYWAGHLSAIVEQHDKILSTSGIASVMAANETLKAQLASVTDKYNRQEQYIQLLVVYENKLQQILVEQGRVRSRDLPSVPIRPEGE